MEYVLELVVDGVDIVDPNTARTIKARLSGNAWAEVDGMVTVSALVVGNPSAEARDLARRVRHALPGATVRRWHDDFVTYPEIAQRADVTREAVRLWAAGRRGRVAFPGPMGFVGTGERRTPVWRWARVSEWLDAHGGLGDGVTYPDDAAIARINAELAAEAVGQSRAATRGPVFVFPQSAEPRTDVWPMQIDLARPSVEENSESMVQQ